MSITVSAELVKELREITGSPMMECKRALVEAEGDVSKAVDILKKSGQLKAVKKSSRAVSEGATVAKVSPDAQAVFLVEINCETDFVGRGEAFQTFAKTVADRGFALKISDKAVLLEAPFEEGNAMTIEEARLNLVAQVGENVDIRRLGYWTAPVGGVIGVYGHGESNGGAKITAVVFLEKGNAEIARSVAMQVTAMNPEYATVSDVPNERLQAEKEIVQVLVRETEKGKPDAVLEKIIDGRLKKFVNEITLTEQVFIKDSSLTVGNWLKQNNAVLKGFIRFQVGEGIVKKENDFAKEVMDQVNSRS